ncbi:leader peptidase (prepilin peptidase)/N-methyltransferase [Sporomusaceae bacterium BoRhaA]|uniref:prepilin peptidase n=1 Tax=Pelorhabdus rhamnosifermentans TaxID=2772457 RepID=UPI0028B10305|nr:prepilin peptidase [Pelorhabdus rhamnosifermentans]MBU2703048.1 leader peptidase (prepilin peptidase)/N-methyltransferase [Pelorhabdus rhamnosifermentans]
MADYLCISIFGLIMGSFLNVCIDRLPLGQSIIVPPSHCFVCGTRLGVFDLVPVFSYIFLRGRCRVCGAAISMRYPLLELLTSSLFCLCFVIYGWTVELTSAWVFTAFLLMIAFIDYDYKLIFDKLLIPFAAVALVVTLLQFSISNWQDKLLGALFSGVLLFLIVLVTRGGMGMGDAKFATVLGLWLGITGMAETLLLSFVLGGIVGAFLLVTGKKKPKDPIPFGPFICLAALTSYLYGQELLQWYINCIL